MSDGVWSCTFMLVSCFAHTGLCSGLLASSEDWHKLEDEMVARASPNGATPAEALILTCIAASNQTAHSPVC
eukprot:5502789-Amphidinium_carterae.1